MSNNVVHIGVEMSGEQWAMMGGEAGNSTVALILENGNVFIETSESWRENLDRFLIDVVDGTVRRNDDFVG